MIGITRPNFNPCIAHYTLVRPYILLLEPTSQRDHWIMTLNHSSSPVPTMCLGSFQPFVPSSPITTFPVLHSPLPIKLPPSVSTKDSYQLPSTLEHIIPLKTCKQSIGKLQQSHGKPQSEFISSLPAVSSFKSSKELLKFMKRTSAWSHSSQIATLQHGAVQTRTGEFTTHRS